MLIANALAFSQGTLIYDQESVNSDSAGSGPPGDIQAYEPMGQSFTPALSSVGFISVYIRDENPGNSLGATVHLDLWANSIGGTSLGATEPISMPDGYGDTDNEGVTYFYFLMPIPVIAGGTYYFQPVVEPGSDAWEISAYNFGYAGGQAFFKGVPSPDSDLWFREGIVVPEPSAAWLVLLGGGLFFVFTS
ncbi:MAG: hypothetical protein KGJ60_03890 [Verrucomicrobiota bacterium]|nr:hypothetical protein [Verrucomicrobiota bacterium]